MHEIDYTMIQQGDVVEYDCINMDANGFPTFYDTIIQASGRVKSVPEMQLTDKICTTCLVIEDTHIKVNRMMPPETPTDQIKCGIRIRRVLREDTYGPYGVEVVNCGADEVEVTNEDDGWLVKKQLDKLPPTLLQGHVTLYVSSKGRIWIKTADGMWVCVSASNGMTMSSTVKKNATHINSAPISEGPMKRLDVNCETFLD